jgi:hypothetical protein
VKIVSHLIPFIMKAIKGFLTGLVLILAFSMQAQVSVSVSIGAPPLWGPAGFSSVRYYYLPDVEAYYDVQSSMFIYYGGGVWVHRAYLPPQYRNYDLYGGYKVVMTGYHGSTPYNNFKDYKKRYGKGYHGGYQKTVGERPGKGNSGNKPSHKDSPGNNKSGHGNDKGSSQGHEKSGKDDHGKNGGKGKK